MMDYEYQEKKEGNLKIFVVGECQLRVNYRPITSVVL
jgi:hypothetical protein